MAEQTEQQVLTEQDCLNKIIAAGANALSKSAQSETEKALLDNFIQDSFEVIMPCWEYLNEAVQFKIFKLHLDKFTAYMKQSSGK